MNSLEDNLNKKYLLDILAYFLWEEKTVHELSPFHIGYGKILYKEILENLKGQAEHWKNTHGNDFDSINRECQDLGNLFFFEKRLELIEERLIKRT